MSDFVEIPCSECLEPLRHRADVTGFYCPKCERRYEFLLCPECDSAIQVQAQSRGGFFSCEWCWSPIKIGLLGRKETATAEERRAGLDERGLSTADPDNVAVGGFTLIGVSGFPVEIGSRCSVLTLPDAVDIRAEIDGDGVATVPYTNLTKIDISGGTSTTDAGMIGGGFGLQGAAEGIAVASILNALSRKTSIRTWLWIASPYGDLRLHQGRSCRHS